MPLFGTLYSLLVCTLIDFPWMNVLSAIPVCVYVQERERERGSGTASVLGIVILVVKPGPFLVPTIHSLLDPKLRTLMLEEKKK